MIMNTFTVKSGSLVNFLSADVAELPFDGLLLGPAVRNGVLDTEVGIHKQGVMKFSETIY